MQAIHRRRQYLAGQPRLALASYALLGVMFFNAAIVCSASAATLSISASPPGAYAIGQTANDLVQGSYADDIDYVATDRPAQGQFFTTGANTGGYQLTAITIQRQGDGGAAITGSPTFTVRITTPGGGSSLAVNATETGAFNSVGAANDYVTFTFSSPVALLANTQYGFDLGAVKGSGGDGATYLPLDGTANASAYTGGNAYSTGTNGVGNLSYTGHAFDRTFYLAMTPVPEPSTVALLSLGMGALILAARRRFRR